MPDDRIYTGMRIDRDVHARLKAAAQERRVSTNFLVSLAIEELLDNLIPVEDLRFQWTKARDE